MKKTNIFKAIMMMCLMLVGATVFTACGEDPLDTNQYTGSVKLLAYGPNPVARMGELRIVGVGLDQVQSVTIPGAGDITDITRISSEEIRITVPNEAVIGKISLNCAAGKIESLTALKYTEPVGFDDNCFSAAELKPGETLTIKGEYLNLVQSVIFAENVVVGQITNSRKEIKVVVPAEARTGRVAISFCATGDSIPNQIFSPVELKITLPAVNEVANLTGKKPGDKISQKGTNLDLVTMLSIANEVVEFTVADNTISYTLPESTPAQATVTIYPASGVVCPIAYIGMQLPTELKATPAAEVKAGDKIVITGKDLDVVTNVQFAGSAAPVEVTDQSATSLTVEVPADAKTGDITLNCKSGATATVAIVTAKPEVESYNPAPVNAGNTVTINGKNLELVAKVVFADNLAVTDFVSQSEKSIEVVVPATAVSGELAITMKNGEQVTFKSLDINSPEFCFIPELPSTDEEIKAGSIMTVNVKNGDKLQKVLVDGEECQIIINGETLLINIPESAGLSSVIKLISSNGEIEYSYAFIPNTQQKRVVWQGMTEITWGDGGRVFIPGSALDNVPEGAIMTFCYTQKDQTWAQAQVNDGWWGNSDISTFTTPDGAVIKNPIVPTDIYGWFSDGTLNRETSIVLTAELLDHLRSHVGGDGSAIIIQGSDLIFSQVYITWEISLETNINGDCVKQDDQSTAWTFPSKMTWGDDGRFRILRNGPSDLQNFKFKAGKTVMRFYKSGTGQIQVNNPNWGSFTSVSDWNGDVDVLELVLTQDIIDCFTGVTSDGWSQTALILQGDGLTVSKITIE